MILSFLAASAMFQANGVIRTEETAKRLADVFVASVYEQKFRSYTWKVTLGKKYCYALMLSDPAEKADDVFVNCDFILEQKSGGLYFAGRANGRSLFDKLEKGSK